MALFNENNIRKYIVTLPFIGIVVTSIILTVLFINQLNNNHKNEIKQLKDIFKAHAEEIVQDRINNVITIIKQKKVLFKDKSKDELKQNIKKFLNEFRFKDNGYIFAYDLKGNTISHIKQSLIGTNRWELKNNGQMLVQDIINFGQKENGDFIYYTASLNPNKKQTSKKISYIKKLSSIDWVIGTGIYTDNLDDTLKEKERYLNSELSYTIKITLFISFILTMIGVLIMFIIANNIFTIITRYRKILAHKNETLEEKVKERTQEQDTLLSLFNEADTVLFKWNCKTHKLTYISKSIYKILGYSEKDFLNETINYKDCIYKDDLKKYKTDYQNAIKNQKPYCEHKPYRIITKDNQMRWIHGYTLFIRNEKNELTYFMGYITDVTMVKEHDKTIYEQAKLASLGEMLGNIAHQWRQPLSTISTAASGLKLHKEMNLLTDETFNKSLNAIMRNSNYLSETIDIFKNYIKSSSIYEAFEIHEVLEEILLLVDGNIRINHINIVQDFEHEIKMHGNKHELIQVCINIINNAVDVLKEKDQTLEKCIFITTKSLKGNINIEIKDNAGGVNENIINKIFEPYFTTKHKSLGTGLGLYMAHNIVHNMKGRIYVANAQFEFKKILYKGASFTIELPLNTN